MQDMILDRYQIIETIGRGGYGTVLHAYDTRLKREVAIKTVDLPSTISTIQIKESESQPVSDVAIPGLDEARAAGKLSNANIVTIYDCVVSDGVAYVIEEYVEGITLSQLMRALNSSITLDMITEVFRGVSNAIVAAHKKNILHLDIKPDNVLIGRGGEVKVADFGLATLMDVNGEGVASAGTIGYMPPEQMRSEILDVRSDEWSLAMIVYELLTGSNPLAGSKEVHSAISALENAEMVVPSVCWPDLDDEVDDIVFAALSLDPAERYENVKAFADSLKGHLGSSKIGKRELATFVNGDEGAVLETLTTGVSDSSQKEARPFYPLIDRIGSRGAKVISRGLAVASVCMLCSMSLANIRLATTFEFGVFSQILPFGVGIVVVAGILTAIWPCVGALLGIVFLVAMLLFNQAWGAAITLLICGGLWWGLLGRKMESSVCATLLCPLAGSVGLGALAPSISGAVLDIREASFSAAMMAVFSLVLASLGSMNLFSWDVYSSAILAVNPEIAGSAITSNFVLLITTPTTWIVIASWIVASFVYALFCRKGTRSFDTAGSIVSGAIIIAGSIPLGAICIVSACIGAVAGIVAACISLTDRVRLEPGIW